MAARTASPLKIERIRALGATVRLEGDDIEDARLPARRIAADDGAYLVEDSLDIATCEGAATIGLELFERTQELHTLVIALCGGAMASGVGYVMNLLAPHVEVIAVQPKGRRRWRCRGGKARFLDRHIDTIADGVAGRCPIPEVLDDLVVVVDDVVLVSVECIMAGMRAVAATRWIRTDCQAGIGKV